MGDPSNKVAKVVESASSCDWISVNDGSATIELDMVESCGAKSAPLYVYSALSNLHHDDGISSSGERFENRRFRALSSGQFAGSHAGSYRALDST